MNETQGHKGAQPPPLAFTVILRLQDGADAPYGWVSWTNSRGLLGDAAGDGSETHEPYKRYPVDGHMYFVDHVGRALFPPADRMPGGRWLRRPSGLELRLGPHDVATHRLSIELLEIVRFELHPYVTFGLVHLSFAGVPSAQDMIECSRVFDRRFRETATVDEPRLELAQLGAAIGQPLDGREPLVALATQIFGSAHAKVSHRAWICAIAERPSEIQGDSVSPWRRAVGRGLTLDEARDAIERNPDRNKRQTLQLGPFTGMVFGRSASFTHDGVPLAVYNVRSYWAEVLLFAIVQHEYLEGFAAELGELGPDPLGRQVDDIYVRWLAFRNVLGWSYLSDRADVPQRLLAAARPGLGMEPLHGELEQSFRTYVAQRQRLSDDAQEAALASIQVYGAVFAAVGTVAATLQIIGDGLFDCWLARIAIVAVLATLGACVYRFMRRRVTPRPRQAPRQQS
jgi:hypothetical protein